MGISLWKLLLTLFIIILLFGTKKLKDVGSDVAGAITNFRKSLREQEPEVPPTAQVDQAKDVQVSNNLKG